MNILQVVPYFPPAYAFGGPVKVVYSISKELVKRGHNVTVYTTDAMSPYDRLNVPSVMNIDGIDVQYMRNLSLASIRVSNLFIPPRVAFISKSELKKFNVIHLHEFTTFQNVVIAHYARKVGVPYVLQTHGSIYVSGFRKRKLLFNALFGKKILRNASKVIALSNVEKLHFQRAGVPDYKIAILGNGIDLTEYSNLPPKGSFKKKFMRGSIQDNKKMILYLGRIHRTKGIDLLIKAYVYLVKTMKCDNTLLVIAGPDDGYLSAAKSLADSSGISDSILFTGFIDDKDKLAALVDADLFVTPSFYGFPMTFLEASIVGVPIVTTTLGDKLDWIDDNAGLVAQPTSSELAKVMYSLLTNIQLAAKFAFNGKEVARSVFSLERVVDSIEQIYKDIAYA
jgi:glycosyltransferase involved in cell wall biosynthesis